MSARWFPAPSQQTSLATRARTQANSAAIAVKLARINHASLFQRENARLALVVPRLDPQNLVRADGRIATGLFCLRARLVSSSFSRRLVPYSQLIKQKAEHIGILFDLLVERCPESVPRGRTCPQQYRMP